MILLDAVVVDVSIDFLVVLVVGDLLFFDDSGNSVPSFSSSSAHISLLL
jgi:hypothetical protein